MAADEALLAGMASGDSDALAILIRRYQQRVFGVAGSILSDPAAAEDVAQETFLRAWRHADNYDPLRGSVAAWLLTITRRLAIDAWRMRRSTPVDPDTLVGLVGISDDDPEQIVINEDQRIRVRRLLGRLPPDQRRALVLAAWMGHTAVEISELEGIPVGTVKTRIRTAMQRLAGLWSRLEERP